MKRSHLTKRFAFALSCLVLLMSVRIPFAYSAGLTLVSDDLTSHTISAVSNHDIQFTTSSGVSEGETIVITFDSEFDTSSLTEDDVDVTDDDTHLTTAADCSGSEEASITIASDIMTITICAGDGGTIASSSAIDVTIGTDATESGTGSNQITNPSTSGTYSINIDGTFGDFGAIYIPILSGTDVGVSADVPSSSSSGGSPGGDTETDTTAPNIFNVECEGDDTTLEIIWDVDESASGEVAYGETDLYEIGTESSSTSLSHHVDIAGLTPGTEYHYQITVEDAAGNTNSTDDATCSTTDTEAPEISDIDVVEDVNDAFISWNTNESATCTLEYGTTDSYGSSASVSSSDTSHSASLSGLISETEYHFLISCTDSTGNSSDSTDRTFTTLEDEAPANANALTCSHDGSTLSFTWELPSEDDLSETLLICNLEGYPTNTSAETTVFVGSGSDISASASSLSSSADHFCTLFLQDGAGSYSSGSLVSCNAEDSEIPVDDPDDEDPDSEDPDDGDTDDGDADPSDDGDGDSDGSDDGDGSDGSDGGDGSGDGDGDSDDGSSPDDDGDSGEGSTDDPSGDTDTDSDPSSGSGDDAGTGGFADTDISFYTEQSLFRLSVEENILEVIPSSNLKILADQSDTSTEAFTVSVGDTQYLLGPSDDGFEGIIETPSSVGIYDLRIENDEEFDVYTLVVLPLGYTYELSDRTVVRVPNSFLTLERSNFGAWTNATTAHLSNPTTSLENGSFAWYVENGIYRVRAQKSGYEEAISTTFEVTNNIAAIPVEMTPLIPIIEEIQPFLGSEALGEALGEALNEVQERVEEIVELPEVQTSADVATVASGVIVVSSAATLASSFNLLNFLRLFATSPILFFNRRKRKAWGIVYNAGTKQPVDLATVRLYQLPENRLVQTRVTDSQGRYVFLASAGQYRIVVQKPGFTFPSNLLAKKREDGERLDLYHGEEILVSENASIAANIPIDPADVSSVTTKRLTRKARLRRFQNIIALIGILLAIAAFIVSPNIVSGTVALAQILVYLLVRRLAKSKKAKNWGIVYDKGSRKPLANAVIRIFEPTYNKLLDTAVTDSKGRYSILVGPNTYYATYEKKGYKGEEVNPIDVAKESEGAEISYDVSLERE